MYRAIIHTKSITVKKLDRNNQMPTNTFAHLNSYEVSAHSGDISHSYRLESMKYHWIKVKTVKSLNNMSNILWDVWCLQAGRQVLHFREFFCLHLQGGGKWTVSLKCQYILSDYMVLHQRRQCHSMNRKSNKNFCFMTD